MYRYSDPTFPSDFTQPTTTNTNYHDAPDTHQNQYNQSYMSHPSSAVRCPADSSTPFASSSWPTPRHSPFPVSSSLQTNNKTSAHLEQCNAPVEDYSLARRPVSMPVLPIQHQHTSPTPPPPPPAAAAPPSSSLQHLQSRPKITTSIWEDEGTLCYQVDTGTVCVARRQDNDMVNGTKLLNVTGMSRGKRDGILKNEKGRVVVKVGAMHLKGVWVTYSRAKALALQYNIMDALHPLLVDDPGIYFFASSLPSLHPLSNYYLSSTHPIFLHQSSSNDMVQHDQYNYSVTSACPSSQSTPSPLPSAPSVPSMLPMQHDTMFNNSTDMVRRQQTYINQYVNTSELPQSSNYATTQYNGLTYAQPCTNDTGAMDLNRSSQLMDYTSKSIDTTPIYSNLTSASNSAPVTPVYQTSIYQSFDMLQPAPPPAQSSSSFGDASLFF